MPLRKLAVYLAYQTDCQLCSLREQCLAKGAKGDRARRLLPPPATVPVEHKPVLLGPIRWVDVAGRALRRTWMTRLSQARRRDPSACLHAGKTSRSFRLPACRRAFPLPLAHLVRCDRIIVGEGLIGSHAMPGLDQHNGASPKPSFPLPWQ